MRSAQPWPTRKAGKPPWNERYASVGAHGDSCQESPLVKAVHDGAALALQVAGARGASQASAAQAARLEERFLAERALRRKASRAPEHAWDVWPAAAVVTKGPHGNPRLPGEAARPSWALAGCLTRGWLRWAGARGPADPAGQHQGRLPGAAAAERGRGQRAGVPHAGRADGVAPGQVPRRLRVQRLLRRGRQPGAHAIQLCPLFPARAWSSKVDGTSCLIRMQLVVRTLQRRACVCGCMSHP